ncbi:putative tubulin-specific chaperone [Aspergillus saccharolyticus JOP 1030-1]|uniref:Tubulin-specific chaperone E n=1 Tax=Aspergillus saccharolyticus JOP 1030-1 TaxID=1450539 RepID=A0A318ZEG6_9EURO|nr:tubulin-specific chaperone [Aspergillus saccharolyticus JOP 1030-1]PYH45941.1 tubulin-specific chaperone [Aspergillus saccharolyticus JOP 1030-1]
MAIMATPVIGQRRSYAGDLCTVRYVGTVEGTTGDWLGVEWDDPTRGKHSGEHKGVRYFTCQRNHPTAGSFVRPSRPADKPRGLVEALREKYASEYLEQELARQRQQTDDVVLHQPIEISGKVVEEVGFDKIRKQLAELQELKIVLLDGLRVAGVLGHEVSPEEVESACQEIEQTCPKITELDLSRNLVSRWSEVARICERLKLLKSLKLGGNRFGPVEKGLTFSKKITELYLDETLLAWDEISAITRQFPALTLLSASANQLSTISTPLAQSITRLTLENNTFTSLSDLRPLTTLPRLEHLSLRSNSISTIAATPEDTNSLRFAPTLTSLDLSRNQISTWLFLNHLPTVIPALQTLRISGNPLFDGPIGPTAITGLPERPMTVDEAYMLTLARLAGLRTLNYGIITPKDRLNGELYYLSLIAKELSASPQAAEPEILAKHPRYAELCELHGQPVVTRASAEDAAGKVVNPRSVAARLVRFVFCLRDAGSAHGSKAEGLQEEGVVKAREIPRSFDTYQVQAIAGRLFGLPAYRLRLVWETDELDPVSREKMEDEDWDTEGEGEGEAVEARPGDAGADRDRFVKREVELVESTKDIGFWVQPDVSEVRVRVEVLDKN